MCAPTRARIRGISERILLGATRPRDGGLEICAIFARAGGNYLPTTHPFAVETRDFHNAIDMWEDSERLRGGAQIPADLEAYYAGLILVAASRAVGSDS